jgi:hypothetical protein
MENQFPDKNPFHFSHKDKIDELDVLAFDQKIKKIHKKKFKENYKNIELIQSVYDAPTNDTGVFHVVKDGEVGRKLTNFVPIVAESSQTSQDESSCGCKKTNEEPESYFEKKKERIKQTVQNMKEQIYSMLSGKINGVEKTPTKIIEGYSHNFKTSNAANNISIDVNNKDPFYWLFEFPYEMFQYVPLLIDAIIYDAALGFANVFTLENDASSENIEKDAQVIHDIIALTLSFPLCIFITYNWFFLFAYKTTYNCQNTDPPVTTCRPANDSVRMKLNFDSVENDNTRKFLNLMFDFSVKPLEVFDELVFGDSKIPMLCMIPYRILVKFILLGFSVIVVTWFSLLNSVDSIITGSSFMIMGFAILVIVWWCVKCAPGHIIKITELFQGKAMIITAMIILFGTIRLIIAIFSISTSSILITFYFWIHSLFGIAMYGENGFGGIQDEIEKMDAYMDEEILWLQDKDTSCFKPELWRKVLRTIVFFIYDNFYAFWFLIFMSGNLMNAFHLQSQTLGLVIKSIIGVQLFMLGVVMFIHSGKANSRMVRVDGKPATTVS